MIYLYGFALIMLIVVSGLLLRINHKKSRHGEKLQDGGHQPTINSSLEETADDADPTMTGAGPLKDRKKKGELNSSILIVDDQATIRMLLAEVFISAGMKVYEAASGSTAIRTFHEHPTDVVLLDLKMPEMNGIETLHNIRQMDNNVIVIMISAYGEPDDIEAATRLGVNGFFNKPFDIEQLRDHVLEQLEQKLVMK